MPRAYDQENHFRVTLSGADVRQWMKRWPASGLKGKPLSFTFVKTNGDLVETTMKDGPSEIADDAQRWGEARLGLAAFFCKEDEVWPWGEPTPIATNLYMVNAYDPEDPGEFKRPDILVNASLAEAKAYAKDFTRRTGFKTEVINQDTGAVAFTCRPKGE